MASFKELYKVGLMAAKRLKGPIKGAKITAVYPETTKDKDKEDKLKLIIELNEGEYRIALNHTQGSVIAKAYGDDYDEWVGHKLDVTKGKTNYGTDIVDCLVITPVKGK